MTVQELYNEAFKINATDEDIHEVQSYLILQDGVYRPKALCALCVHRKTDKCPFPNQARLADVPCLSYETNQEINLNQ